MPASYLSLSSPIKRETNTYVDQDGVQFSSMLITATAASAPALVPAIGSVYELNSNLWVTQSDLTYSADGLGKITVTAAGPSLTARPRVRIIAGGPKIFGLKPSIVDIDSAINLATVPFDPSAGVTIEVQLIDLESNLNNLVNTYSKKTIPSAINGQSLPEPASGPRSLNSIPEPYESVPGGISKAIGFYNGFICTNIRTETRGKAMIVFLSFQESGYYASASIAANPLVVSYTTLFSYNYP